MRYDSPGHRIVAVLDLIPRMTDETAVDGWASVLGLSGRGLSKSQIEKGVYQGLIGLLGQVDEVDQGIARLGDNIDRSMIVELPEQLRGLFSLTTLAQPWVFVSKQASGFDKRLFSFAIQFLPRDGVGLDPADLQELKRELQEFKVQVAKSGLSSAAKRFLEEQIGLMEAALWAYPSQGPRAFREASLAASEGWGRESEDVTGSAEAAVVRSLWAKIFGDGRWKRFASGVLIALRLAEGAAAVLALVDALPVLDVGDDGLPLEIGPPEIGLIEPPMDEV